VLLEPLSDVHTTVLGVMKKMTRLKSLRIASTIIEEVYFHYEHSVTAGRTASIRYSEVWTDCPLSDLLDGLQDFASIALSLCDDLHDEELTNLAAHNPRLTSLSIACCGGAYTSDGLFALTTQCADLTSLEVLVWCEAANIGMVTVFSIPGTLHRLTLQCHKLTTSDVLSILKANPRLRKLTLQACNKVNKKEIVEYVDIFKSDVEVKFTVD
jgi:hypothetical protein